jgi:polyphosphate kinase
MERNLDKRIEVGVPITQKDLKERLDKIFSILWKGNVKARIIDAEQKNRYVGNRETSYNAQDELYKYYQEFELNFDKGVVR